MSVEDEPKKTDHHRVKLAAGIGAAGIVAASGAIAFGVWSRHRNEAQNSDYSAHVREFEKQAAILFDPRLKPADQELLPEVAVQVYIATRNTIDGVIPRKDLVEQLGVTEHRISHAMGYLRHNDLVKYRKKDKNNPSLAPGFYARPALAWAIEEGDYPTLQQRYYELMSELNDGMFFADEQS